MRTILAAFSTIWLGAGILAPPAACWDLVSCGSEHEKEWQEFARALRATPEGEPGYLPNPLPGNDEQAVEDFLHQHRQAWRDTARADLPYDEQRFSDVVEAGRARFEVLRLVNWTPLRCGPTRERAFFLVIRVFDQGSGDEITRAAIEPSGLFATLFHRPASGWPAQVAFVVLEKVVRTASARLGRNLTAAAQPQFVTTWGSIRCDVLTPCVALRDGAAAVLVRGDQLFRIGFPGRVYSLRDDLGPQQRAVVTDSLKSQVRELVSLGGDVFVEATPIPPAERGR